jgi:hypothetical protein
LEMHAYLGPETGEKMTKASLIMYGNCQAGVFADSFKSFASVAIHQWDMYYVMNFIHPSQPQQRIADEDLARCTLVIEQLDTANPLPAWLRERLPHHVKIIRFAPLDFNLYWPFNITDPRNVSEPPDYPFGRFPYGDRIVVELLREGLTGRALWRAYQERSSARLPDPARLLDLEAQRLIARDAAADIRVADLVLSNYREVPLFWTINHPTGWLLGRVLGRLLRAAREPLGLREDPEPRAIKLFSSWEPFGHQHQPVHPELARRSELTWWTPERKYRYFDGSDLTFEEFMLRYINFT